MLAVSWREHVRSLIGLLFGSSYSSRGVLRTGWARIATAAAMGVALVCAAPVRADVVDDAPAVASPAPGVLELYATAGDGNVQQRTFNESGWSDWSSVGTPATSGPAAIAHGSTVDLLARGTAGTLVWRSRTNGVWSGLTDLGGGVGSAPSVAIRRNVGNVDLTLRGSDNVVYFRSWSAATGWSAYESRGGGTLSAPAIVSYRPGFIHIFARSMSNTVDAIAWDGSAWSAWATIGGEATSGPAAVSDAETRIDVFVRGADSAIHRRRWDGTQWLPWERIDPTPVSSGPAAIALGPNHIAVFARMGSEIGMNVLNAGAWSGWIPVRPNPAAPGIPAATACGHSAALTRSTMAGGRRRTVSYGRSATITGVALGPDRQPVPGAVVHALDVRAPADLAQAVAGADGRYRIKLAPGISRTLRIGFQWPTEGFFACGRSLSLKVRAGVRMSASRRVRMRGRIRINGHLLGGRIPPRGKVVELQGWARGAWQVFRTTRTSRNGRFHVTYRLRTGTRGILRIRARVRRERGYPYTLGYSRVVRVRVG
jgi:hypothetical protein